MKENNFEEEPIPIRFKVKISKESIAMRNTINKRKLNETQYLLDNLEFTMDKRQKTRSLSQGLPDLKSYFIIKRGKISEKFRKFSFQATLPFKPLGQTNYESIPNYKEKSEEKENYTMPNQIAQNKIKKREGFPRSADTIRKMYYSKLIHKKFWNPSRTKKKQNTLIIFDWDDTLLPTTFLTPGGEYNDKMVLCHSESEQFKLIEKAVYKILTTALEKGETYIITNAAPGWVEYTSNKYYPTIVRVLQNIKILSARGGYEKLYPRDYRQWKIQTFLEMKKEFESNLITNILCMGDSMIEMEAGHLLSSKFSKAYIKTIKFRESPKLKVLYKQLCMIIEKFNDIYLTLKSLAISIDKKATK